MLLFSPQWRRCGAALNASLLLLLLVEVMVVVGWWKRWSSSFIQRCQWLFFLVFSHFFFFNNLFFFFLFVHVAQLSIALGHHNLPHVRVWKGATDVGGESVSGTRVCASRCCFQCSKLFKRQWKELKRFKVSLQSRYPTAVVEFEAFGPKTLCRRRGLLLGSLEEKKILQCKSDPSDQFINELQHPSALIGR